MVVAGLQHANAERQAARRQGLTGDTGVSDASTNPLDFSSRLTHHPTLTDAEREALEWCVEMAAMHATECDEEIAALRGLLERTK